MPQSGSTSLNFGLVLLLTTLPGVYNGFACLSNPCLHGVCLDDLNSTYFCYCIDGYTGLQCQTNWNDCWSSPCQNGGVCLDGIATFNCSCPPGFIGDLCEEDFNECESNPCWNNGTCVDGSNGYVCQCIPGYSGIHCEIDIAVCNTTEEARCSNGGTCIEGPGDTFSCRCKAGWEGVLCDTETNECLSAPCQNGAVCIDLHAVYECACPFGFTGKNCEQVVKICEKNPCKNGALCLIEDEAPVCYCVPDFHGELCELQYDECLLGPKCSNGGTCIDGIDTFTCSCPPSLTGVFCECLILQNNKLDCNYISPPSTKSEFTTASTLFTETEFSTEISTTPFSVISTTTATLVPNITTTQATETTTVPFCITQTHTTPSKTTVDTAVTTTTEITTMTSFTTDAITITQFPQQSSSESFTTSTTSSEALSSTLSFSTPISSDTTTSERITTIITTTNVPEISTELRTVRESTTEAESTTQTTMYSTDAMAYETTTFSSVESSTVNSMASTNTAAAITTTTTTVTLEETTTIKDQESNRTFPEEGVSIVSTQTTFFTELPTSTAIQETSTRNNEDAFSTTIESIVSSTLNGLDCTVPEKACKNGGTCVYNGQDHQCACPFDSEGDQCEIKLGIKNAAFNGNSYLSHRLKQSQNISIEFEAKTLSLTGLLFHFHTDDTYMALYVENGYLVFKFSCGYHTMLLSEQKVPVNNGYSMTIKATLNFSKDVEHCDAFIKINDTLAMSGDQTAKINQFSKPEVWLHLGGFSNDLHFDRLPSGGFVGCMSNLKISGKRVYIYKDAEDGYDITECSSLACLSNPCKNGASCSSHGESWKCHCRNGFLGDMCEISTCDNNPCLFGGTCIPFSNNGYICLCPYGKHGHFCENDLQVTEPYFSSSVRGLSSFIAYQLPEGISQKMDIKFRFTPTTMEQISLLLFMGQSGQHDFYSDHLAVSFVKGYIMLTWNMGSGPRRIFTSQPIETGARDYLVRLGYETRRAWLYVENLGNITGRSPGASVKLDTLNLLYLGGHESRNFSLLPHDLPYHTGFSGCIFDIEVQIGSVVLPLHKHSTNAVGRAVGQCGTTECYEKSCQNGGACLHHGSTFMCLCQDKWYGPLCSSKTNFCDSNYTKCSEGSRCVPLLTDYECDCPQGKVGRHCDKEENITDISFTGVRSFLSIRPVDIDNNKFNLELEIRILKENGVIFFMGQKDSSFVCLSVRSGLLELKVHANKIRSKIQNLLTVRSTKLLLKGAWYKVQFGLFGRKVYLYVDHTINTGVLDHGFMLNLNKEPIYLGGLPDLSEIPIAATSTLPTPYSGCLRHFSINEQAVLMNSENITDSRNVIDCDGTPCGGEVCLHGGTCRLDIFMNPHCDCVEPYYGERCEFVPTCTEKNCKNGHCSNSSCSCHVGYEGGFCETELRVRTPAFLGKSYLIVRKQTDKKRNIKDMGQIKKLFLNFTTAKNNGLLFWTKRDKNFLGLGLEKGFLKIIYSLEEFDKRNVEVVPYFKTLSDGLWHSVELLFAPLSLKIDNKTVRLFETNQNFIKESPELTDGLFFIGGVSGDTSKETNGLFTQNFEGCLQALAIDSEKYTTNFSSFEGANVNQCHIV